MAAGIEFDPAEFAAFKARAAAPARPAPPAPAQAPASDGFDPAEFQAFKAQRGAPSREPGRDPGALQIRVGRRQEPEAGPSFDERFGSGPMASAIDTSDPLGAGLQRAADERLVGKPSFGNAAAIAAMRVGNTAGLNIPRNVGAAIASLPVVGNGRRFSENYQLAHEQEDALARQYPKTAIAGTVGGIGLGAVGLPAFGGAASTAGRVGQAALTGGGYGLAAEAFDSKDLVRAGQAGLIGFGLGGAGGFAIEKLAPVVTGLFRKGVPFRDQTGQLTDAARTAMRDAGVDPADITPDLAARIEQAFTVKGPSAGAAREALAAEQGITLSRGQATLDPRAVALETDALSGARGGRAERIGQGFAARQAGEIDAARGRLQGMAARGEPLIDNPQSAFEAAADRARQAGDAATRRTEAARQAQEEALRAVRGPAPVDALDGATTAVQGVREAAERSRGAYREAYGEVGRIPGSFAPGALDDVGAALRRSLGPEVPVDPVLTPAAHRALADLDGLPAILRLREGEGPTLQQIEQVRKRLVSYYGGTGQNPTDRRALRAVTEGLDQRIEDLLAVGRFGPRPAPSATPDGFPGAPRGRVVEPPLADAITMPDAPAGSPETMGRYMARNGGVQMIGDARANDLHRAYYPGAGTLARRNGTPLDQIRVKATEAGYLPPGADGETAQEASGRILDMLRSERIGRPHFRIEDEARIGGGREAGRIAEENAAHAEATADQARRMAVELHGLGLRPHDLDGNALHEAAERMVLGHADDAATAYEQAVARRAAEPGQGTGTRTLADDAPFPAPGEGTAVATSDALPIGDTAPAEAMRNARGLFREHRQTFAPRGPGDVAGQRLQRIVERDASPNEAVSMLFGTTTGRVSSGQIQTLARLREAVGPGSETWRSVQQSLVARYVGGDGRDLATRLDYLLRGEGRALATGFLDDAQRAALGRLRAAVAQTESAHLAAPAWVQSLERSGFDPNAIASSLFGSGAIGARPGALNEAKAAKGFLGGNSAEWAMLRQAAVQRLTDPGMSAGKVVERLQSFTDGPGSGVARELFDGAELAQLRRFGAALRTTILPDGRMKPDAGVAAGAVAKALDVLAGMVAFKAGGLPAAVGVYGAKAGQRAVVGGVGATRARRSFEGGAPRMVPPPLALPTDRLGLGVGLGTAEAY